MNPLVAVAGLFLLFFLPGLLLLLAVFPRHRWFGPFHVFALPALGILVSTVILVLVGTTLALLPGTYAGKGWFQGNHTGAPIIEAVLATLSLAFFLAAWRRGAFPLLARRRGVLAPETRSFLTATRERDEPAEITLLRDLRLEEARLEKESQRVRQRALESRDGGVRNALSEAADDLERQRAEINARAREVERRAAEKRFMSPSPASRNR